MKSVGLGLRRGSRTISGPGLPLVVAMLLVVSACTPAPVSPTSEDACVAACAHLGPASDEHPDALGCEGWDSPTGTPCVRICQDTEETGFTSMHPQCVVSARSCAEASRLSAEGCE